MSDDGGQAMSDNKIEAIRARHNDDTWRYYELPNQMHDDRAFLLAEVERLRADLLTQQGCCDGAAAQDAHIRREREEHKAEVEKLREEIERLRAALEGIRIDGPDAHDLVWATFQHPAIAVRSQFMIGSMERMDSQAFLEFEQMRRKALEGKP